MHDGLYAKQSPSSRRRYSKPPSNLHGSRVYSPRPKSAHAIRVAIDEALRCKETGEEKTILFGLTGTGYFDMVAYEKFHDGTMTDYIPTDAEIAESLSKLPKTE